MKGAGANLRAAHCQQVKLKCPKRKRPGTNSDQDTVIPVAWFKNSEPYVPSSSYNVSIKDTAEKSTLTFKQFRSKHAGVYSCYLATSTGLTLAAEYNVTAEGKMFGRLGFGVHFTLKKWNSEFWCVPRSSLKYS